jgi:hypothetical protein
MTLAEALAERVHSLARTHERVQAIEDQTDDHLIGEPDARVVLRRALAVLGTRDGYEHACLIVAGDRVAGADELARAGLVVWDLESDTARPTSLLIELMKILEPAVSEVRTER